jgi:uncharacterized protein YkwD
LHFVNPEQAVGRQAALMTSRLACSITTISTTLHRDRSDRLAVLAATSLLLLAGCGGGGGADAAAASQVAAAPALSPAAPAPSPTAAPAPSPVSPSPAPAPAPSPAPPPAPAPAPASGGADITCGLANFQADALRLVNARRAVGASCGARGSFPATTALTWNTPLTNASYGHSRDMAVQNYFSHTSADGRTLGTRVTAAGYTWQSVGENIAAGYGTVQQVVDGWMASDGHCANLMGASFQHMGLACARQAGSAYGTYWTLDLARPR